MNISQCSTTTYLKSSLDMYSGDLWSSQETRRRPISNSYDSEELDIFLSPQPIRSPSPDPPPDEFSEHSPPPSPVKRRKKVLSKSHSGSSKKTTHTHKVSKKREQELLEKSKGWNLLQNTENYEPFSFPDIFSSVKNNNFRSKFHGLSEPVQFFELFMTPELLNYIVEQTNKKAEDFYQSHPKKRDTHARPWTNCTVDEIKTFITIMLHMGIIKAASYHMYWTKNPLFRVPGVATTMTRDRFSLIKKHIYFSELQEQQNNNDRLAKIRHMIDLILGYCEKYWIPNPSLTIDESMVKYTGRHTGIVFMPRKPIRRGFKIYVLADVKGYVIRFYPSFCYTEKTSIRDIVFNLIKGYERKGYHIFMDRYFCTVPVFKELQLNEFYVTGAINNNRIPFYERDKELIKALKPREMLFWKYNDGINDMVACGWFDTIITFALSTRIGNQAVEFRDNEDEEEEQFEERKVDGNDGEDEDEEDEDEEYEEKEMMEIEWATGGMETEAEKSQENHVEEQKNNEEQKTDKKNNEEPKTDKKNNEEQKTENRIGKPKMFDEYSRNMHGVDHFNQACSYYRFSRRSKKWYRSIVSWLVEVAMNNSYIIYKTMSKKNRLRPLQYRMNIIQEWCKVNQTTKNADITKWALHEQIIQKIMELIAPVETTGKKSRRPKYAEFA